MAAGRRDGRAGTQLGNTPLGKGWVHKVPLETVKVLVIGPGGREHAIVRSLLADPNVSEVHAAPGNAGISKLVPTHNINGNDPDAVARRAYEIYLGRGGNHGADIDDWLKAERELKYGPSDVTGPASSKPRRRKGSEETV